MKTNVETITPRTARTILDQGDANRGLRKKHVARLARAMARGEWELNGKSIVISEAGALLDGQHRLHAVVLSGVSIESVVVRGVPARTMATIDDVCKRTAADALTLRGRSYTARSAAAARMVIPMLSGHMDGRTASLATTEIVAFVEGHSDLVQFIAQFSRHRDAATLCPSVSRIAAVRWFIGRFGNDRAREAIAVLFDDLIALRSDHGRASSGVIRHWIRHQSRALKLSQSAQQALIIRSYNQQLRGGSARSVALGPTPKGEWPRPLGVDLREALKFAVAGGWLDTFER